MSTTRDLRNRLQATELLAFDLHGALDWAVDALEGRNSGYNCDCDVCPKTHEYQSAIDCPADCDWAAANKCDRNDCDWCQGEQAMTHGRAKLKASVTDATIRRHYAIERIVYAARDWVEATTPEQKTKAEGWLRLGVEEWKRQQEGGGEAAKL